MTSRSSARITSLQPHIATMVTDEPCTRWQERHQQLLDIPILGMRLYNHSGLGQHTFEVIPGTLWGICVFTHLDISEFRSL
jgi:hypothetical protein